MTRLRLLVGSAEFWAVLQQDIARARSRVWVQTLSFEGDSAGKGLAQALLESGAPDRRVLVDEFTRWVQNDRFLFSSDAMADQELQAEVRETDRMIRGLSQAGVAVRWGSPVGFLGRRAAWRNHKKLIVIDHSVCYLGGINITEHNFGWHDMMVRIEDPDVTRYCGMDFERSWSGERASSTARFKNIEIFNIDPPDLSPYQKVWSVLDGAREEILVESAYITVPLSDHLARAAARGVAVKIISPEENNIPLFRRFITAEAVRHGFELRLLPGMTHMKAILVDGRALVLGSSNFHFTGHWTQSENAAVVTDPGLVADFLRRVAEPDWARSTPFPESDGANSKTLRRVMRIYGRVASFLGQGRQPPPRPVS